MNLLQISASDPQISTWVSASAGTGKTKILTDRVLRLMLRHQEFEKILCLTFTNVASLEMKTRISTSLSRWSKLNHADLKSELFEVLGREPLASELSKASSLCAEYLKSTDNINVQTIHSFCQTLLKKFPLEAGISPNFQIIDEYETYSILKKIKQDIVGDPKLEHIISYMDANFHTLTIDEIFTDIAKYRTKFSSDECNDIYNESLAIISELQKNHNSHYTNILRNPTVQNIVGFNISIPQLKDFFLTKDGKKKKRISTKKIVAIGSSLYSKLEMLQEEVYQIEEQKKQHTLENHSKLLSLLATSILSAYAKHKSCKGVLDYDDLIIHTNNLLNSSHFKDWVLYKLDGGIKHLLVDEAQDTSRAQWQIIESLIEEFYSGGAYGAQGQDSRTVFVVGDEKQSIFSFQGADVSSFSHMNQFLKEKMISGGKEFKDINLETSYRSTKEILDIVHRLFNNIKNQMPSSFTSSVQHLTPYRTNHSGVVELWSICDSCKSKDSFWQIKSDDGISDSGKAELARKISLYIKDQIATGRIMPSTGKKISAGDFMILFRRRNEFTEQVIKELQNLKLPIAGIDRIFLKKNLAVTDLLSVAKFVLNMHDDLNLASLLKSPIIGITERDLYDISTAKGKVSIWSYIKSSYKNVSICESLYNQLSIFINLFYHTDASNFFQHITDVLGYRAILNSQCGSDSNDAIDELLYACHRFVSQNNASLQGFLFWIEQCETSIKRDIEMSIDSIKIMTTHGAKGLQAPFVILCDTTNVPTNKDRFVWDKDGKFLSAKNDSCVTEYYKNLKSLKQDKEYAEYLRLLYVGMTRAEDHLIICGYQGNKKMPENCWYELVRLTMLEVALETEDGTLIYGNQDDLLADNDVKTIPSTLKIVMPDSSPTPWEKQEASKEIKSDSMPDFPIYSPLSAQDSLEYGLVFHKILEDSVNIKDLSMMYMHPLIQTLAKNLQERILISIKKITLNDEFSSLIKKESKTELSLGAIIDGKVKTVRLDLMVVCPDEIIIIDYKSDISVPSRPDDIPEHYVKQLSLYKEITEKIYPDKTVKTMILWLQNGLLNSLM